MKRDESIRLLNQAVSEEMAACNQYMYFHFQCDDQGYDLLAGIFKRYAICEMIHVEKFAERILFLKGDVDMIPSHNVQKIHDLKEMLETARKMEETTIEHYNEWAKICGQNNDAISKTLFEDILAEEEGHFDDYDTELEHIKTYGEKYLALQTLERTKNIAHGKSED
jgi:bacterioferritin